MPSIRERGKDSLVRVHKIPLAERRHIWLDPVLAKHQVEVIRDGFIVIDPDNADYYNSNAAKYIADLESLDASIRSELSTCEKSDFIAFHNAFGRLAEVIAGEIPNGRVLTLSPIEGIDREDQAQGIGYLEKMQENLESLKVGLKCQ